MFYRRSEDNAQKSPAAAWRRGRGWPCRYLDGGDVEGRGDAEDGHDDGLVFLVDEDLHVPDVFFSGHLGDVLVGDVGFSGPAEANSLTVSGVAPETAAHAQRALTSGSAAPPSAPSDAAWLLRSNGWPAPSGGLASSPPPSSRSAGNDNWTERRHGNEGERLFKKKGKVWKRLKHTCRTRMCGMDSHGGRKTKCTKKTYSNVK